MADYSNFDLVKFALLLEKAKGDRSINQYANTIDVSAAHISRLLRKLVKSPPAPDTINKFAGGAYNGVTYSELMLAAGHINNKIKDIPTEEKRLQMIENKRKFFQVILSDLYARDFEWTLNKSINGAADIMLEITKWEYSKWYIKIVPLVTLESLFNVYGKIACIELTEDIKISIAVSSTSEFELLVNKPPRSIRANIYVMLVDLNDGKIINEEKLCQF
jgi:hypothetical protein